MLSHAAAAAADGDARSLHHSLHRSLHRNLHRNLHLF